MNSNHTYTNSMPCTTLWAVRADVYAWKEIFLANKASAGEQREEIVMG